MLVYQGLKRDFMDDVERDAIVERIRERFEQRLHRPSPAEVRSWQNSMQHMYKVLNTEDIPQACGVAIEFGERMSVQSASVRSSVRGHRWFVPVKPLLFAPILPSLVPLELV